MPRRNLTGDGNRKCHGNHVHCRSSKNVGVTPMRARLELVKVFCIRRAEYEGSQID